MTTLEVSKLSDDTLLAETVRAAEVERRSTANLLALLVEVEQRGLHLKLGHSSMFGYCTRTLRLSEQAAYSRITAARAARRFPQLLTLLADGALTLSSVGLLAPHLTEENCEPLLAASEHKSTREVERLVAYLHPQPDVVPSVRALPVARQRATTEPEASSLFATDATDTHATGNSAPFAKSVIAQRRAAVAPIAPKRYLLRLTIGQETHDNLQRLRALLRHSVPDGDPAAIVDRALKCLLKETERTKFGASTRPARETGATNKRNSARAELSPSRHIPAAIKRAVWRRDQGRCVFRGDNSHCGETAFLEFHHVVPFAEGGATSMENLELRCRAHNAYEARAHFDHEVSRPAG